MIRSSRLNLNGVRRLGTTCLAAIVAATGMLVSAPLAHATTTFSVSCTSGAWAGPFTVIAGTSVTFDGTSCGAGNPAYLATSPSGSTSGSVSTSAGGSATVPSFGTGQTISYTAPAALGSDTFYVNYLNTGNWLVQITVVSSSGGNPPPWLQMYGRPSQTDACRSGWDPSWAEWAITKTGGWVCQRTIYWHDGAWFESPSAIWGVPSVVGIPWNGA
jgi:hypothetical protein